MPATLRIGRVFHARDKYYSRGTGFLREHYSRYRDCDIELTMGEVPSWIIEADLTSPYIVDNNPTKWRVLAAATEPNSAWIDPAELYTTITILKTVDVEANPARIDERMGWFDLRQAAMHADEFRITARGILDGATAVLVHDIGAEIMAERVYESHVVIAIDGKPAQNVPDWYDETNAPERQQRRTLDLPVEQLDALSTFSTDRMSSIESIGRWYWLAKAEYDAFRRFMWAFAGLEVICKKTLPRIRSRLLSGLTFDDGRSTVEGPALTELLWPTAKQDEGDPLRDPERNLVFRFAALALSCSPNTANDDVAVFKRCQAFRNRIHGQHVDGKEAVDLADKALALLTRYTPVAIELVAP